MARQLRTQLEQETQFDPLADPKPAAPAPSHTIHSPAPTASSDEARAAPAQLAATTPPDESIADEPKPG
jgi:hypothetical protein